MKMQQRDMFRVTGDIFVLVAGEVTLNRDLKQEAAKSKEGGRAGGCGWDTKLSGLELALGQGGGCPCGSGPQPLLITRGKELSSDCHL